MFEKSQGEVRLGVRMSQHFFCQREEEKDEKKERRLPLFLHKGKGKEREEGLQYIWDGGCLRTVPCHRRAESLDLGPPRERIMESIKRVMKEVFVPEQVKPHYTAYLRWKCLHRVFSSALQVQCTQAMLRALGVGAKRSLPSAAALNWVLKDGLGRLGRFVYTASLGSTFDCDLKRVRFSTSVLFSMSLCLELLTPRFPDKFLLLATVANVAKSISLAAYIATTSTIHRSFALGDNLADISAKSQAQTVVLDNLGLGLAVCVDRLSKVNNSWSAAIPWVTYPLFSAVDLYALYQGLKLVHLSTLNKTRLEIIVERWLEKGHVPSLEDVSMEESWHILPGTGQKSVPLRIGAMNLKGHKLEDITEILQSQIKQKQKYFLCMESSHGWLGKHQHHLLLCPHKTAVPADIIMGMLQASYLRVLMEKKGIVNTSSLPLHNNSCQSQALTSTSWQELLQESGELTRKHAGNLVKEMKSAGWVVKYVLLNPAERTCFSTEDD